MKATTTNNSERITWAEAEKIYPGIEAEWSGMCGQDGTCVPPTGQEWRLEVSHWENGAVVHVIQIDPAGEWESPPEWRRWATGQWTHPYPIPEGFYRSAFRLFNL